MTRRSTSLRGGAAAVAGGGVWRRVLPTVVAGLLAVAGLAACGSSDAVPYNDPSSAGLLVLYDGTGKVVTSGSVNEKPFIAYAVSDHAAPKPYDKSGRKAALLAFQPRSGADPARWGGDYLTGSTPYPDPAHPTAHAIDSDISLANFLAEFPVQWDGLVQLRMYLGAPDEPGLTANYFTAEIRVKDGTWTLVRGAAGVPGGIGQLTASPTGSGS